MMHHPKVLKCDSCVTRSSHSDTGTVSMASFVFCYAFIVTLCHCYAALHCRQQAAKVINSRFTLAEDVTKNCINYPSFLNTL